MAGNSVSRDPLVTDTPHKMIATSAANPAIRPVLVFHKVTKRRYGNPESCFILFIVLTSRQEAEDQLVVAMMRPYTVLPVHRARNAVKKQMPLHPLNLSNLPQSSER